MCTMASKSIIIYARDLQLGDTHKIAFEPGGSPKVMSVVSRSN